MKKKLLELEQSDAVKDFSPQRDNKVLYFAKRIDKCLYLEFYDKNKNLICRHLNDGKDMATQDFITEKITSNGYRKLISLSSLYWGTRPEAIGNSFDVVKSFLEENGIKYTSRYDEENLIEVISLVSGKRNEKKKQRKKERINAMFQKLSPLPKSWDKFLENEVMKERFGFFDTKSGMVYVTCCEKEIERKAFKKFKEHDFVHCPSCGRKIQMYSANPKRKKPIVQKTAILVDHIDEKVCFRYFNTTWNYQDFKNIYKFSYEGVRSVYEFGKKKKNYELENLNSKDYRECIDHSNPYVYYAKYPEGIHYPFYSGVLYTRNLKQVIKKTAYRGLGIETMNLKYVKEGYGFENVVTEIHSQPYIEQLLKAGYDKLVLVILSSMVFTSINKEGTTPASILAVQKQYLRYLKNNNGILNMTLFGDVLTICQEATKKGINDLTFEKAKYMASSEFYKPYNYEKAVTYSLNKLKRVERLCKDATKQSGKIVDFDYYKDYMSLVRKLGLNEKSNRFPKNIIDSHDKLNSLWKANKNELCAEAFKRRAGELKDYNIQIGTYSFIIPSSPEDLVKESDVLHHCVASCYTEKYADGETNLVFIRNTQDIETPFVTMEFRNGKVIQVRAVNNSTPSEEVLKAVEIFKQQKLAVA